MKGFRVHVKTSQPVDIYELKKLKWVEDIRTYGHNSLSIKVSLYTFFDRTFGLELIKEDDNINEPLKQLLNLLKILGKDIEYYRISGIEFSFFYFMERGRNFDSYLYIFKLLAATCDFKGVDGIVDWKMKKLSKVQFGSSKYVNKSPKKLEIYSLDDFLEENYSKDYLDLKDIYPIIDEILVFDIKMSIPKEIPITYLKYSTSRDMALGILEEYLFTKDIESVYKKEIEKNLTFITEKLIKEKDKTDFSHSSFINEALRRDHITNATTYVLALKHVYQNSSSCKVITSRAIKIFSTIEQEENLILIKTVHYLEDIVAQIRKSSTMPRDPK